jgi:hypothetical protein
VCNNLPAESTSPENGWRSSVLPIPHRYVANQKKKKRTSKILSLFF